MAHCSGGESVSDELPLEPDLLYGLWADVLYLGICDAVVDSKLTDDHEELIGERIDTHKGFTYSARDWLDSPDVGAGSFRWICGWLDLDETDVREFIQSLYETADKIPRRFRRMKVRSTLKLATIRTFRK